MNNQTDVELINEIYNVYLNLIKYNYEEEYDCILPEESSLLKKYLNKYKTNNNYGNVVYENHMYSDKYDQFDKDVKGFGDQKYMNISIVDAIKRYEVLLGDWPSVVKYMGKWYEQNIHTYQGDDGKTIKRITNKFNHKEYEGILDEVRDDCTGFISACVLLYIAANDLVSHLSDKSISILSNWYKWHPSSAIWDTISNANINEDSENLRYLMLELGFEELPYNFDDLLPFDIIAGNNQNISDFHHGEIYAGKDNGVFKSWSWGKIHDKANGGLPAKFVKPNNNDTAYHTIWRMSDLGEITDRKELGFE